LIVLLNVRLGERKGSDNRLQELSDEQLARSSMGVGKLSWLEFDKFTTRFRIVIAKDELPIPEFLGSQPEDMAIEVGVNVRARLVGHGAAVVDCTDQAEASIVGKL
jgi:hypothetical protein